MTQDAESLKQHAKKLLRAQRSFREELIQFRKEQNLTQGDVADLLGITQGAVAQFEHYDANPTLNAIRRYALAIGADVEFKVRGYAESDVKSAGKDCGVEQQEVSWDVQVASAPIVKPLENV